MNRGYVYRETVTVSSAGTGVLDHLASAWPHADVDRWRGRIERGEVTVAGRTARADEPLEAGVELAWHRPPWIEPDVPDLGEPVHFDDHLIVLDKPAGLPTLPGGGFLEHTVLHRVRERFPDARPAHRLGRWTTGLIACTRGPEAARSLARAFRDSTAIKRYRALAAGDPPRNRFRILAPIGPVPYAPLGTVHAATLDGRPAESEVTVIRRGGDRFLADVRIATGRPHQIRIHLAFAGHPLCGDPLYAPGGRPGAGCRAVPGDPGYRLHAMDLEIPRGPWTHREFRSPPRGELSTSAWTDQDRSRRSTPKRSGTWKSGGSR